MGIIIGITIGLLIITWIKIYKVRARQRHSAYLLALKRLYKEHGSEIKERAEKEED